MRVQNEILSNLKEGTDWKRIFGKRTKFMDQKYEDLIMKKLLPVLNAYDIEIEPRGYNKGPGKQTYMGFDSEGNRILFVFTNANKNMDPDEKKRWTMFLRIFYKDRAQDVGMIDLNNKDDLNKSFSLITQTLEDMGFKLKDDKPQEEVSTEDEEEDPDIQAILDYKNSLSESELKELEKELKE